MSPIPRRAAPLGNGGAHAVDLPEVHQVVSGDQPLEMLDALLTSLDVHSHTFQI